MELDEIVEQAQKGDKEAMEEVVARTSPLVKSVIGNWSTRPGDRDVFGSVLNACLMECIQAFDRKRGHFAPYLKVRLGHAMFRHFAKQARYERGEGVITEAFHKAARETGVEEFARIVDTIGSDQRIGELVMSVFDRLTAAQFRALQAIVRGETFTEAAKRHRVSPQSVSKGLQSLKKMIAEVDSSE